MSWQELLRGATTEVEVLRVVHEFLQTISPGEVERLPKYLRPRPILRGAELAEYAVDLLRADLNAADGTQRVVHRMSAFYSMASIRVGQLADRRKR